MSLPHRLDIVKNVQKKPPVFLEQAWRTGTLRPLISKLLFGRLA
jgi:hypothetical protein